MTFGLITEGVTEHRIIKHIISKYFKEYDPDINQIQPKIIKDQQDPQSTGGWHQVLSYCERDDLADIFIEVDYLVIQIDSDMSPIKPFDVQHSKEDNSPKDSTELCVDIIERISQCFVHGILDVYRERILFAICVHSIECWLLPIVYNNHNRKKITGCLSVLNEQLRRQDRKGISVKDKNNSNSIAIYRELLTSLNRRNDITNVSSHQDSFKLFVDSLEVKRVEYARLHPLDI